jgi:hypothetical protein
MDAIYEYILGRMRLRAALIVALSSDDSKSRARHSGQVEFCKYRNQQILIYISALEVYPFTYPG